MNRLIIIASISLFVSGCNSGSAPLGIGASLPPLSVEGWTNGDGPGDLAGKVVVVDVWAHW